MNKIAKLGEKAPFLQISGWVQGEPTNLDQLIGRVVLIEVFQVNCPGCFLYSFPQAINMYQKYYAKGLTVLGLATAFEDFDKNTLVNLELLAKQNKVIGETLRVLEENKQLIDQQLPFRIPFPLAMDKITKHKKEITHQARHATSRNSGTPVALIRSPTQRMGDALNALVSLSLIYLISCQYIKEHVNLWTS